MAYIFDRVCDADMVFEGLTVNQWEEIRLQEVGPSDCDVYRNIPWAAQELWEIFSMRTLFSLMSGRDPTSCLSGLQADGYFFQRGEVETLRRIPSFDSFQMEDLIDLFLSRARVEDAKDLVLVPWGHRDLRMKEALVEAGRKYPSGSALREVWSKPNLSYFEFKNYDSKLDDKVCACFAICGNPSFDSYTLEVSRKGFTVETFEGSARKRADHVVSLFEAWWIIRQRKATVIEVIEMCPPECEIINYGDDLKVIFPREEVEAIMLESKVSGEDYFPKKSFFSDKGKENLPVGLTVPPSPPLRLLKRNKVKKMMVKKGSNFHIPPSHIVQLSTQEISDWRTKHFLHECAVWDSLLDTGMMFPERRPMAGVNWWYSLPYCFAPFRFYSVAQYQKVFVEVMMCLECSCPDIVALLCHYVSVQMAKLETPVIQSVLRMASNIPLVIHDRPSTPDMLTSTIIPKGMGHSAVEWSMARSLTVGHFPFLVYQRKKKCLYYREGVLLSGLSVTVISPRTGHSLIRLSPVMPTFAHQSYSTVLGRPWIKSAGIDACPDIPLEDAFVAKGVESWILLPNLSVYRTLYWITIVHQSTGHWATRPVVFVEGVWNGSALEKFPDVSEEIKKLGLDKEQSEFCEVQANPLQYSFVNGVVIDQNWLSGSYGLIDAVEHELTLDLEDD